MHNPRRALAPAVTLPLDGMCIAVPEDPPDLAPGADLGQGLGVLRAGCPGRLEPAAAPFAPLVLHVPVRLS
jgi:hypothetical protein